MRLTECRTAEDHFNYLVETHGDVLTNGGAPRPYFRAVRVVRIVAKHMRLSVEQVIEVVQREYVSRLPAEIRAGHPR